MYTNFTRNLNLQNRSSSIEREAQTADILGKHWTSISTILAQIKYDQGPVVQRWVSANPELKFNLLF
jgi:hypothetical protein